MTLFEPVLQAVTRGQVAPAYLLVGEEVLLREEFLSRLLRALLPSGMESLNLEVLVGTEAAGADLITRCRTVPAFSPRRVVVLKEADRLRPEAWESLLAYLETPASTTCLICVAEKLDPADRRLQRIEQVGKLLRFASPRTEEERQRRTQRWISERARQQGKSLTPEAHMLLLTLQGPDLLPLAHEVDKLCLFVGDRAQIDLEAVEALVGHGRVQGIFALTRAVGHRDVAGAMSCLKDLLVRGEEPLRILGMLARQVRLVLRAKELLAESRPPGEISRLLGIPRVFLSEILEGAKISSVAGLEGGLVRLLDLDRALKSTGKGHRLYLEFAVMDLCSREQN
jgi:DNA polymerase III subunit delta